MLSYYLVTYSLLTHYVIRKTWQLGIEKKTDLATFFTTYTPKSVSPALTVSVSKSCTVAVSQ